MAQAMGILKIDRGDASNALGEDIGSRNLFAEGQGGEDRQLAAGIEAVNVSGGVSLSVAKALGFGQDVGEGGAVALDFGQNVVAGSIKDAVESFDPVAADAFAQDRMDRDAASDAGFHRDVRAVGDGRFDEGRALGGHEFLVRGDNAFAGSKGRLDDLLRHALTADEFGDNFDFWMIDDFAPIRRNQRIGEGGGDLFACNGSGAERFDDQTKAQFLGDGIAGLGQDGHGTRADVA